MRHEISRGPLGCRRLLASSSGDRPDRCIDWLQYIAYDYVDQYWLRWCELIGLDVLDGHQVSAKSMRTPQSKGNQLAWSLAFS